MLSSVEVGIRLTKKNQVGKLAIPIGTKVNYPNHVQIKSDQIQELLDISMSVHSISNIIELSYYVSGANPNSCLFTNLDQLYAITQETKTKFIVVYDNQSFLNQDLLSKMIHYSEKYKVITCLDLTISEADPLEIFKSIKNNFESPYLMSSIYLDHLRNIKTLKLYTESMKAWIGIVSVKIDKDKLILDPSYERLFGGLLDHLFWLPFKQQPLIIDCPVDDFHTVYRFFLGIINNLGYIYP